MKDWLKRDEILSPLRKGQSGSSNKTVADLSGRFFCLLGCLIDRRIEFNLVSIVAVL